ncbi:cellulase [Segetibacter sp. 3557_3]|uniref:glycoside hydrolase family 9 protein n=1 Tax=Segetibacter sp. 3557_3 TaxID=2547429 RepID=UPI0010591318|nr:glycoside hydrolase family 9 protein [Segetibacter sp. 3557_3]TDH23217.1 cellulase [Segetibacter sp. 3557_3]
MNKLATCFALLLTSLYYNSAHAQHLQWIRINQLGYTPAGIKVAVWCSKENTSLTTFRVVNATSGKVVSEQRVEKQFGAYGPFTNTCRLNFSAIKQPGSYYLTAGKARSATFTIDESVYDGTADFCLQYMRQQRSGFNPFLNDSCHTHDGYTMYGPMPDSTHIDVSGGWHDASDYLQYSTTSANATWHLLAAYRDYKAVFGDTKQSNGLDGANGLADVLDEGSWGLKWLLKMFPRKDWLFNQLGDDRDHMGMRIPKEDSFYGKGFERPVYFATGEPQGLFRFKNQSKGTSSTAAKFASAFALGQYLCNSDSSFYKQDGLKGYYHKALDAFGYANKKLGVTQTAPGRAPYYYEEANWTDDMELATAALHNMVATTPASGDNNYYTSLAYGYAQQEKITPWLGADTARHYQWYPFVNAGHYELAAQLPPADPLRKRDSIIGYYRAGINRVWNKAQRNAFYRAIPFIWCSNNLTVSFALQCTWYRRLTGDRAFDELEQANVDWLFGCNPWGTSMVYGLPGKGDTPVDPHSAFTHLKNYPINGGLVDGPVYTSIYKNLIGITLKDADEYEEFQSDLAVYHDDYGDYSTNEPTMDGTASLIYLLAAKQHAAHQNSPNHANPGKVAGRSSTMQTERGAIVRGSTAKKQIALVFTADEYGEGLPAITSALTTKGVTGSFFFTGRFYRSPVFKPSIAALAKAGYYLGPHSDQHLLYCDWQQRERLLVTKDSFTSDLQANLRAMVKLGLTKQRISYFMPPFEWYNDTIASWSRSMGLQLINYTSGTNSNADYTWPGLANYRSSADIYRSILDREAAAGLNGFILLLHAGTDPRRTDKFYNRLPALIDELRRRGYSLVSIPTLLNNANAGQR